MTAISPEEVNDTTATAVKVRKGRRSRLTYTILDNFVWVLVVLLLAIAGVTTPSFFEPSNLVNILTQSSVLALLTLAETICLIAGYFDLSIESILIFAAVFAAWLI
ncbi:MAG: hypothetical protein ACWGQW_20530, partial [bacterium]